jgi:hypothetical protein
MARELKHVGKMTNNDAKIIIVYRTLPGDPHSALVVGTSQLGDTYHDALMNLLQDVSGQQANEFADIMAVRKFPDGSNMLEWLHTRGHLKKVPTSKVMVTPNNNNHVLLEELNKIIAEQRGVRVEDLAVNDGSNPKKAAPKKDDPTRTTSSSVNEDGSSTDTVSERIEVAPENLTPTQLRSRADKLFKEAQLLRKQADEVDPPKSKKKVPSVEA